MSNLNNGPDQVQDGERLYDWYDADGNPTEAWKLTYREARFIFGSDQLRAWKHVPHGVKP